MKNWEPSPYTMIISTIGMCVAVLSIVVYGINSTASTIMMGAGTAAIAAAVCTEIIKYSKWAKVVVFKTLREMMNHDDFFVVGQYHISMSDRVTYSMLTDITDKFIAYAVDSSRGIPLFLDVCQIYQQLSPGTSTHIENFTLDMINPGFYTVLNCIVCSPKNLYKALTLDPSMDGFNTYLVVCIKNSIDCTVYLRRGDGTVCDSFKISLSEEFFRYMGYICTMKPGTEARTTYGKVVRFEL